MMAATETRIAMDSAQPQRCREPVPWPRDLEEFERLVVQYQDEFVNFAFWRLGNRQDAEDAVQDVLVRAWNQGPRLAGVADAVPFLYRMLINRCTDTLRRAAVRRRFFLWPQPSAGPFELTAEAAEQRRLAAWLDRLPRAEAEVVRLRVFSDLPFSDIAAITGAPVPTAKSRFRYGLERLRKLFEKEETR